MVAPDDSDEEEVDPTQRFLDLIEYTDVELKLLKEEKKLERQRMKKKGSKK
jgi:hypothetical protein